MGFNTAALILNDGLFNIEKDTEVGQKIGSAIRAAGGGQYRRYGDDEVSSGGHVGVIKLLPSQHADTLQIIAVGGNTIRALGYTFSRTTDDIDILRGIADHLGFTIRKKPARSPG